MHKSIAASLRGVPLNKIWHIGLIPDHRFTHLTRIEVLHWHLCYDLLNWPKWMAVQ